jgi:hypothetical protein
MNANQLLYFQNLFYEEQKLLTGRLLVEQVKAKTCRGSLADVEFRVFSQWGDDGIIQWLVKNLDIRYRSFIEFGVQNYRESNTRFLMMNDNWSGLIIDSSEKFINDIRHAEYYYKYDLEAVAAFVDADNINRLISGRGFDREVGLLHIDIDGNDYWIWNAIDVVDPVIVIMEYNALFGWERAISIPYDRAFDRMKAHYSGLYFGASLPAFHYLAQRRGYAFVGCNTAGNNAFFVKRDRLNGVVRETGLEEGFVKSRFRQARDEQGQLVCISGRQDDDVIKGLPVVHVPDGRLETL